VCRVKEFLGERERERETRKFGGREREKRKLGGVLRETTVLEGVVIETYFGSLEGSQVVPTSPSGKGEACIGDFFNFDFKDVGAAVVSEM
jgi:hypothetical protein